MMPTVEERAREALNGVAWERGIPEPWHRSDRRERNLVLEVVCRLIEAHDAFKQEVSDAVDGWVKADKISADARRSACEHLVTFIIPKPVDPLVEAIREASVSDADDGDASRLRAALAARGGKIVWENANAR